MSEASGTFSTFATPHDAVTLPRSSSKRGVPRVDALFVLNSLNVGGSETKTVRLVNALLPRGVRAGVAYLNAPHDLAGALDPAIPVWHLQRRGKFSVPAVRKLRALIREQRPAVVLSVNLYPSLYLSPATFLMTRPPRTVGLLNTSVMARGEEWRQGFYRPFLRQLDTLVYGCELQRRQWDAYLGYPQSKSTVIYNGVDTEHFVPPCNAAEVQSQRKRQRIAPQAFVIGTVGRLAPEKNQLALIEATAELRRRSIDAHLLLVGAGRMRAELEQRVAALQLQAQVTFAGVQSDVRTALNMMDVFVLPSTHVETFSNAALEAMAMCRPVILSRIGGAAEMVREGVEGFTLPLAQLEQELVPLLIRFHAEQTMRERLGQAARQRVEREFSLQAMVDNFASLIGERVRVQKVS